jgi:hypothetical protein
MSRWQRVESDAIVARETAGHDRQVAFQKAQLRFAGLVASDCVDFGAQGLSHADGSAGLVAIG